MDAGGLADGISLLVVGVKTIIDAARADARKRAAARTFPTPAKPVVTSPVQASVEAALPPFHSRPHCDEVGGYEAYLKRTAQLCRLH
jgi:hypothetical protein